MLFVGVAIPLTLFGMLADELVDGERFAFDLPVQMFLHQRASTQIDHAMLWISDAGSAWCTVPLDLLVAAFLIGRKRLRQVAFWLMAVGGSAALNVVAKHAFSRQRPTLWVSPAPESTFSFPSGHAMQTASIVTALLVLLWHTRWRIVVGLVGGVYVIAVSMSRIYLGVHFPSDVLAAWLASIGWVVGLCAVSRLGIDARSVGPATAK